jgi:hypothetical protein
MYRLAKHNTTILLHTEQQNTQKPTKPNERRRKHNTQHYAHADYHDKAQYFTRIKKLKGTRWRAHFKFTLRMYELGTLLPSTKMANAVPSLLPEILASEDTNIP